MSVLLNPMFIDPANVAFGITIFTYCFCISVSMYDTICTVHINIINEMITY